MGPKMGRRMRKIEVPTFTPTWFRLGDTAVDIKREEREQIQKEESAQKQQREGGNGGKLHTQQRTEWPKSIQELRGLTLK